MSNNPRVKVIFRKKWLQSIPSWTHEKHVSFQNLKCHSFGRSHEINLIALNITFPRWECLHHNECVSSQRQIRTSTGFTYSECWWFGTEGSASLSPATLHREAGGFLMPLLCVGPSVQKCHRHVKIVDMSDERPKQSMCTTLFLLILVRWVLALSS